MTIDRRYKQFCSGVSNGSPCYRPYEDLQELNHWVNKSSVYEGQTFEVGHLNDYEEYWWFHGELIKKPKMNTVPFDYSLIEKGYTAQSKSGRIVADMHLFNFPNTDYSLHVQFADSDSVVFYAKNGMVNSSCKDDRHDLVMVPPVEVSYHVYYPFDYVGAIGVYDNLESAKRNKLSRDAIFLKIESFDKKIISKTIVNI